MCCSNLYAWISHVASRLIIINRMSCSSYTSLLHKWTAVIFIFSGRNIKWWSLCVCVGGIIMEVLEPSRSHCVTCVSRQMRDPLRTSRECSLGSHNLHIVYLGWTYSMILLFNHTTSQLKLCLSISTYIIMLFQIIVNSHTYSQ